MENETLSFTPLGHTCVKYTVIPCPEYRIIQYLINLETTLPFDIMKIQGTHAMFSKCARLHVTP